ncbi:MAG TPA: carboxymuconolactone decarboxylase family protein [Candidatus Thiothrix moscowensis]|uniref:carboxymuconolactone decarboxylase family protein n=1 Tax=unclassified Thiothrix TaxID=2636184 RepID=UPI001A1E78D0|nr:MULTISPECIES: carboxymuconolactone decarboxylase family protein [unclassified Thiothrix]MBJ6610588.1 carboxymuconolactone decarboxylase family protein [Candidatus Thiothrix moscowensis]HRJ52993.1 carboxymuconolactone decarboxylase family protein [Candidatus Thiothrix moscowensis]HRJ92963.1 carboxymuconolactone decarboxylase family protein [Candidatus Thiothrix moscowensis]
MVDHDFIQSLKRARTYGLGEFLEIIGELSQESTKKGVLDRKQKELITLGIALAKDCHRCIDIHTEAALQLGATETEMLQVRRVALYLQASPEQHQGDLWQAWSDSWREFSLSKGCMDRRCRELVGLGIALVQQDSHLINMHVKAAREFGATPEEIFEVMPIALLMDGAPALSQIPQLVHALEQHQPEALAA